MKYFTNPQTLEDLKAEYKKLALKYHPDRGGDNETMKEINSEYDFLFEKLKNIHKSADGNTYTTEETTETANDFRDIIDNLVRFDGIKIEICGSWIWITGNTIPYRDNLKNLRFRWSKSKVAWYYHRDEYRKGTRRTYTLDEIRDLYGSETINRTPQLQLAIV